MDHNTVRRRAVTSALALHTCDRRGGDNQLCGRRKGTHPWCQCCHGNLWSAWWVYPHDQWHRNSVAGYSGSADTWCYMGTMHLDKAFLQETSRILLAGDQFYAV